MPFAFPLWLLGLIPWAGVTVWLLRGRRARTPVPFLDLWRGLPASPRPRHKVDLPPPALMAAILAMFLAIVSAAGPAWPGTGPGDQTLTIIVDRGITMSANGPNGPRFAEAADLAANRITQTLGPINVNLRIVPELSPAQADSDDWLGQIHALPRTAMDTSSSLRAAIDQALAVPGPPVIVLSDQHVPQTDDRLIQIAPTSEPKNVAIVTLSVRDTPQPQAMVGIINQSPDTKAGISVQSDDSTVKLSIDLPPRGEMKNYFIDLPHIGEVVKATLDVQDNIAADKQAWAARQGAWPTVEARSPLPAELQRMIEVYGRRRPATDSSHRIAVLTSSAPIPTGEPSVAVLTTESDALAMHVDQSLTIVPGPLTDGIDWAAATAQCTAIAPPTGDWKPIVISGNQPLVAIQDSPIRRVWVGFHSEQWPTTPDFVVFWTKVFDWVGQGGSAYESTLVGQLDPSWQPSDGSPLWPGIYRRADGAIQAVNAPPVRLDSTPPNAAHDGLSAYAAAHRHSSARGAAACALLAIAAIITSAALWQRKTLTRLWPTPTV